MGHDGQTLDLLDSNNEMKSDIDFPEAEHLHDVVDKIKEINEKTALTPALTQTIQFCAPENLKSIYNKSSDIY